MSQVIQPRLSVSTPPTTPVVEPKRLEQPSAPKPAEGSTPHVAAAGNEPPAGPHGRGKRWVLGVLLVAGLAVGGTFGVRMYLHSLAYVSTDDAFVDGHVEKVAPQVAGRVIQVLVQDNQHIRAGEPIAILDSAEYKAALSEAEGDAATAQAAIEQARAQELAAAAQLAGATADVRVAEATLAQATSNVNLATATSANAVKTRDRYEEINRSSPGAIARQQLDDARTAAETTAAQLAAAVASRSVAESKLEQVRTVVEQARASQAAAAANRVAAEAKLAAAQARVDRAKLDVERTTILATTTGRVTRRSVDAGNYVQPGQALLAIVGENLWVTANLKETQLAHLKVGQPVEVSVDALPGRQLKGRVDSIMAGTGAAFSLLPPENATGNFVKVVQRVPVKITLDEPAETLARLGIGMSVEPHVKVK